MITLYYPYLFTLWASGWVIGWNLRGILGDYWSRK